MARPKPWSAYPVAKSTSSGSVASSEKCSGKMAVRHGRREAAASTVLSARARQLTLPGMRANSFISSIDATKSVTNIQTYPCWRKLPHAHEIEPQAPSAVSQGSGEASSREKVGTKPSTRSTTTASSPELAQMRGMHGPQPTVSEKPRRPCGSRESEGW